MSNIRNYKDKLKSNRLSIVPINVTKNNKKNKTTIKIFEFYECFCFIQDKISIDTETLNYSIIFQKKILFTDINPLLSKNNFGKSNYF